MQSHIVERFSTLAILLLAMLMPAGVVSAQEDLPADALDEIVENQSRLLLVTPGAPMPLIVINKRPSAVERYAADELAAQLKLMTGQDIDIVDDRHLPSDRKLIILGRNNLTKDRYAEMEQLDIEQYVIDTQRDRLFIYGGYREPINGKAQDRGVLYGVYAFLEAQGVRWYRPEPWAWHVPSRSVIDLPVRKTVSTKPAFEARSGFGLPNRMSRIVPANEGEGDWLTAWYAKLHQNIGLPGGNKTGGTEFHMWNHAHNDYVPPEKYLKDHPEYFALVDGKRGNKGSGRTPQLCLSNPEMQEVFAQNLMALAKERPERKHWSIEPEDGTQLKSRMCNCEKCIAMDDPNEPELMTNRLVRFANIIAAKVEKEMPELRLSLLAYSMHTRPPTNVTEKLHPNVLIMVAAINSWSDQTKPITDPDSAHNARYVQLLSDWQAWLGRPLNWVWEYANYGWAGPYPNYRLMQGRLQYYRDHNFTVIHYGSSGPWGPASLFMYLKAQLMWNPDYPLDRELDLYYTNYYGPAAEPMRKYHESWQKAFENFQIGTGFETGIFGGARGMHALCTPALIQELGSYIDQAKTLAKGQENYERRIHATWTGYELARRVKEILAAKAEDGVLTPLRPGVSRQYLKSEKAEKLWDELMHWAAEEAKTDTAFHVAFKDGKFTTSAAWRYMERDVMNNHKFPMDEDRLLEHMGFKVTPRQAAALTNE